MRKPNRSKVVTTTVKKEIIEIDSDTDEEVGGRMLALCDEVNASCKPLSTKAENFETKKTSLQVVSSDDSLSRLEYDLDYKKYLGSRREDHLYLLAKDITPLRILYNDGNEATYRSRGRAVNNEKSSAGRKPKSPLISRVQKRLKTENGKEDHKPISRTVLGTKESQQKKGNARPGRKIAPTKNTIKLKPTSNVKNTQQKKEDARRGRKIDLTKSSFKACKEENEVSRARGNAKSQTIFRASKRMKAEKTIPRVNTKETQRKKEDARQGRKSFVTKNSFKACKKENEEIRARKHAKSQTIFRASKRLKTENGRADHNSISRTIPVVNTKRKNGEALRERKIPVTKENVKSNSTSHVKVNLPHSFEARKKDNEESRPSIEKSYEYFLSYLRNSITLFELGPQVKPAKDSVDLSDPDLIAVSDYPFSDGDNSPFEANKDGKVIDLEDGIEPDNIFNSSFSKKLVEILRKPYDDNEFLQRHREASLQRPSTRCRELRDGREIEYNVDNQLTLSYLEQYPDFNKKFIRCCYGKDSPRALNLLRGFFFYFENIVLEGAFKPWMYEKRVKRECEEILCIK